MAKQDSIVLSHWYHLFEGMQESTQNFYSSLEQAINSRNLKDIKTSRIDYKEGGVFSAKREYLRVKRREHLFDICAAPYGNGFFVSWWLGEKIGFLTRILLMIPFVNLFFMRIARPFTYYKIDTALMFQESISSAVHEVIDGITKTKGLRALSELERKPILTNIFTR